ncbi:sensor histidine kinase [Streptomyces avicenniae]|uniref:sensor histidine kinase n=1 Tax=Streptomyces avicenniae TaxID=500153 RepID=UPI00069942F0|nr:sensor histidine kinase [Streptomyces avicenniae]
MHAAPPVPLPKRMSPRAWTAFAWFAGLAFTFLIRLALPGESEASVTAGVLFYRWDGLLYLAVGTALTLSGSHVLERRPTGAMCLLLLGSVVATTTLSVGEIPLAQFLAVATAVYVIAATRPQRTGVVALGLALGTLGLYLGVRLLAGWTIGTSAELAVALVTVIAWLIGRSTHETRAHGEALRAQTAARAVTEERLRIARELHDMVAHSIGVIALQAGAARRVIDTQPEGAREALNSIEITGRETLSGLRRMLGALRESGPQDGPSSAPLAPQPGLAELGRLAADTTAAGVRVDVRWRGEAAALPPEIDMSAYRIVQEAVTNVVRHAGTDACRVTIDRAGEGLAIEVRDAGRGPTASPGAGYGLVGMRERVELLHGEFSAGAAPGGGFRVTARLPVPAAVA